MNNTFEYTHWAMKLNKKIGLLLCIRVTHACSTLLPTPPKTFKESIKNQQMYAAHERP